MCEHHFSLPCLWAAGKGRAWSFLTFNVTVDLSGCKGVLKT